MVEGGKGRGMRNWCRSTKAFLKFLFWLIICKGHGTLDVRTGHSRLQRKYFNLSRRNESSKTLKNYLSGSNPTAYYVTSGDMVSMTARGFSNRAQLAAYLLIYCGRNKERQKKSLNIFHSKLHSLFQERRWKGCYTAKSIGDEHKNEILGPLQSLDLSFVEIGPTKFPCLHSLSIVNYDRF